MSEATLVLDANVLISFHKAEWFESLAFWTDDNELATPKQVWEQEFKPRREIQTSPDWLTVESVRTRGQKLSTPGQLSANDWRVLLLTKASDGIMVTSDRALRERAETEYELQVKWAGGFLLETFTGCGITTSEYERGIETYLEDAYLPREVSDELRRAEKS